MRFMIILDKQFKNMQINEILPVDYWIIIIIIRDISITYWNNL